MGQADGHQDAGIGPLIGSPASYYIYGIHFP